MSKVVCADVGCRFNDDNGKCTAKKIELSWHSVVTLWDGRQEFQRCKQRESPAQYMRRMETEKNEQSGSD